MISDMVANGRTTWTVAIETSCRLGSVALAAGEDLMDEVQFTAGHRHGVELIPTVDRLLRAHGVGPGKIRWVFVSGGPGSFTGLRVGITFARALAQVGEAGLVAVPTCEVIGSNLGDTLAKQAGPLYVATVQDAKRKQVYASGFRWSHGQCAKVLDPQVLSPSRLLQQLGRPLWLIGEGIDYHRDRLAGERVEVVDRAYWRPRASQVLKLGWSLAKSGGATTRDTLVPTYIRLPEAQERWQAGLLKGSASGKVP